MSNAALATAIAGTPANTNAIATLDTPFSNDPLSLADGELLRNKDQRDDFRDAEDLTGSAARRGKSDCG